MDQTQIWVLKFKFDSFEWAESTDFENWTPYQNNEFKNLVVVVIRSHFWVRMRILPLSKGYFIGAPQKWKKNLFRFRSEKNSDLFYEEEGKIVLSRSTLSENPTKFLNKEFSVWLSLKIQPGFWFNRDWCSKCDFFLFKATNLTSAKNWMNYRKRVFWVTNLAST